MPLPNLLFNVNNLGHVGELKVFNLTVLILGLIVGPFFFSKSQTFGIMTSFHMWRSSL